MLNCASATVASSASVDAWPSAPYTLPATAACAGLWRIDAGDSYSFVAAANGVSISYGASKGECYGFGYHASCAKRALTSLTYASASAMEL